MEFEWFDPQPQFDFHGIKTLLQQLFDVDATLFDLSALTDLILSQPTLGSTVNFDGNDTDAYAFLSVLNLQEHKEQPFVSKLIQYIKSKANSKAQLLKLAEVLSQPQIPPIGLILSERLINVPAEVIPPMYTMLREEIDWALEDGEAYNFSHYLILSKTYTEIASKVDEQDDRPKKKKKIAGSFDTMYFHPEDEVLHKHALCHGGFDYSNKQDEGHSDSKRAFQELGIKPQGHMVFMNASAFPAATQAVAQYIRPPV